MWLIFILLSRGFVKGSFTSLGAYDFLTGESAPFMWHGKPRLMESIMCGCKVHGFSGCYAYEYYYGHAGQWDPKFRNTSYLRIRDLQGGHVLTNISGTQGYGFGAVLVDAGKVWVFATPWNRCNMPASGCQNATATGGCWISAWVSSDPELRVWHEVGRLGGLNDIPMSWNMAVAKISGNPSFDHLPPHRYIMVCDPFLCASPFGKHLFSLPPKCKPFKSHRGF